MNITTPKQMSSGTSKVEEAVKKFEEQFTKEPKDHEHYHLVIIGEYNRQTCDEIERIYIEAGWHNVKCKTSSENGERGDWLLWWAAKENTDIRVLTLAKARCAKLAIHLMTDERSVKAVEAAERFGLGEIGEDELSAAASAAANAAYAAYEEAYAAAYAAAYEEAYAAVNAAYAAADAAGNEAARIEVLKQCADIVRETITPNFLIAIS